MQVPLVMTIIGPDRTGLVESVARVVADHGGNWLESRMSRLGGEFAGILRIELPVEKRQMLLDALQALQGRGLTVVVRPDESRGLRDARPSGQARNRRA
jgi:glycine cleavage system regulatory protein